MRKYNGAAPYIVRRPYYVRDVEMERVYESCADEIWQELVERARGTMLPHGMPSETTKNAGPGANAGEVGEVWSIGDHTRKWVERVVSKLRTRR